ncbi:hypothetical protein [Ferrimicrobium acidiphilum]|uniref:hypothetical protein n=1 Tax=Ferrimicrobium acidiphilum TaxID=121039 RepID=UPI0023F46989|nr:hypothetical protein [Ferrimicrobium acidiphilum]
MVRGGLVARHLVAWAPKNNCALLVHIIKFARSLKLLVLQQHWQEVSRAFCDRGWCSVATELIDPGCHHYAQAQCLPLRRLLVDPYVAVSMAAIPRLAL